MAGLIRNNGIEEQVIRVGQEKIPGNIQLRAVYQTIRFATDDDSRVLTKRLGGCRIQVSG